MRYCRFLPLLPSVSFFQSTVGIGNAEWHLKLSIIFQRARALPTSSMLLVEKSLNYIGFKISAFLVVLVDDDDDIS